MPLAPKLNMQQQFPNVNKAEWLAKVEKDLKGKPLDSLDFELAGEVLSPFWHAEDLAQPPRPLAREVGWKIGVSITEQDVAKANLLALEALQGGANALWFNFYRPLNEEQKERLLQGIYTEIIDYVIDEEEIARGRGSFVYDLNAAADHPEQSPRFILQQQADFYTSIAHYRAARLCWENVTAAYGKTTPCHIHTFLQVRADEVNQNHISNTVDAVAAVLGGVDTLYLQPSDRSGETGFYRRIARNVHHLLQQESYLDRVADPVAGSYFLEHLTNTIAEKAWAKFQKLSAWAPPAAINRTWRYSSLIPSQCKKYS